MSEQLWCGNKRGTSPCGSGFDISSNRSSTHVVFKKEKILQSHRVNGSGLKASKEGYGVLNFTKHMYNIQLECNFCFANKYGPLLCIA